MIVSWRFSDCILSQSKSLVANLEDYMLKRILYGFGDWTSILFYWVLEKFSLGDQGQQISFPILKKFDCQLLVIMLQLVRPKCV